MTGARLKALGHELAALLHDHRPGLHVADVALYVGELAQGRHPELLPLQVVQVKAAALLHWLELQPLRRPWRQRRTEEREP